MSILRFSDLERAIPNITQKMLGQQLRRMETDGIVVRKVYPQVPPKVEYSLTTWGQALRPVLDAILKWADLRQQPSVEHIHPLTNRGHSRRSLKCSWLTTWHPYVVDRSGRIDRRYYELRALWELRVALRAGDVWLETSRRYSNPESYFLLKTQRFANETLPQATSTAPVRRAVQLPQYGDA